MRNPEPHAQARPQSALAAWLQNSLTTGEHYAGVVIGANGVPTHHLILMAGWSKEATWIDAMAWAGQLGGALPSRQEQALLFANLKGMFETRTYWSSEQHAAGSNFAWFQYFNDGYQGNSPKQSRLAACAVRRLVIAE